MPRVATPAGYTAPEFAGELKDSLTTLGTGLPFGSAGGGVWSDLKNIGVQTAKKAYMLNTWAPGVPTPPGTGSLAGGLAGNVLAPDDEMFQRYAESQSPLAPYTRSTDFDRVLMQAAGWTQPITEEF